MSTRFLQIHTLTNYPASLINRDDAGFAKRMPFGGAIRTRISSQCLKRHWRVYSGEHSLTEIQPTESVRSRIAFERYVVKPLIEQDHVDPVVARTAVRTLVDKLLGTAAKKEKAAASSKRKATKSEASVATDAPVETAQVTVLGRPELDYLRTLAATAIKAGPAETVGERVLALFKENDFKKNLKALHGGSLGAGLGAALFGRMATGDVLANTDAAIHVAHAITVHGQMSESDYFTAIDDLVQEEGDIESGHLNSSELTSGLFYGYVVVDVPGLLGNLGNDRTLAGDVIQRLVHIVATVSPAAKRGSTAPYAYSHLVLLEAGQAQPRTLQNAFIEPVRTAGNLVEKAYDALQRHLADLDDMYGKSEQRAHAGLGTANRFEARMPLAELAQWARQQVSA